MLTITENKISEKIKINETLIRFKNEIKSHIPDLGEEVILESIEELMGLKYAIVARVALFGIKRIYSSFVKDKKKSLGKEKLDEKLTIEEESNKLLFNNENDLDLELFLKRKYNEEEAVKIIELISKQAKILKENGIDSKIIDILMIFIKFDKIEWFSNLNKKDFETKVNEIHKLIIEFMSNNNISENELYGYLVDYDNDDLDEESRNSLSRLLLDISEIDSNEYNDIEIYNDTFKGLYRKK